MKIATVAMDTVWKDPKQNIALTEKHVTEVLRLYPETQVILFPEISLMGTADDENIAEIAETMDGYCVTEVKRLAKKYNVALICGIIEQNPNGKPFNTSFVVSKEGILLTHYRKNHLFTQSREPEAYSAGENLAIFELDGWKCGLSICFDIRFPRLFEAYKKAGAEVVFSGFNWVEGRNKPAIMNHLVNARAHENQFFMVAVDRSGSDPSTSYYGISVIANPYAEDITKRDGIYSYAKLYKDDIASLEKLLPLTESFKEKYHIQNKS